ncbi:heme/hemin ABC transporter substrate-binding protein [Pedobacter metabolipauper]|uniref:Iron complex transport system substrate-binding protein n=1 Tax=Pedobacter metabolipauper TaxID=425513 RepID=A0A4R6STB2_9SPHI|nr:ABC transporter substrate-binding protein [Pedobacter metabolipauper]TDQ08248.1 iron complex transport system substrate-binding protein [Pedobacter metabolipauper]
MRYIFYSSMLLLVFLTGIESSAAPFKRIVTLGGAITETVNALGFGAQIVAVDVTSEYPDFVKKLPKVSRNRSISAEGIMAFRPDLVIAPYGDVPAALVQQLQASGIRFVALKQEYSVKGAITFIKAVGDVLGVAEKAQVLAKQTELRIQSALTKTRSNKKKPRVLFIYARGTGTMTVAGKGSNMEAIINLAGGYNAIQEFNRYKSYSTEALVSANPDVILMFDFGLKSLGGVKGIMGMPGVEFTKAGKNNQIVAMDGDLLINFSVRLDQAILALNKILMEYGG